MLEYATINRAVFGTRTVLGDVVEIVPSDDEGTGHLRRDDTASQDTSTDGNVAGEGALLVCATYATYAVTSTVSGKGSRRDVPT